MKFLIHAGFLVFAAALIAVTTPLWLAPLAVFAVIGLCTIV
jgi:hypothetical protein